MMISTAVLAAILFAMGVTANATGALPRGRSVATALAGGGLMFVVDGRALDASTTSRLVGTAAGPAVFALLARAMAGGGRASRVALAVGVLAGPVHLVIDDPFRDPLCRISCEPNPIALAAWPTAAHVVLDLGRLGLVGALTWMAAGEARRRNPLVAAALVVVAVAAGTRVGGSLPLAAGAAVVVVATEIVRATTRRARLATIVSCLSSAGDPIAVLARIAPGVEVGYRVAGVDGWVSRAGSALAGEPPRGTFVELRGPDGPIAQIRGIAGPLDVALWTRVVRGPTRLALDNARHDASVAVRRREVLASCRQLVAAADDHRRCIERDLHDGAQQRVLALGMQIGRHAAECPPGDPSRAHLNAARLGVGRALEELRDIAHGIHAATLASGLGHALDLLAYRSPVPLEIGDLPDERVDPLRAVAVHALVEDAVWTADGLVRVEVATGADDALEVRLTVKGSVPLLARGHDRVRALGGELVTRGGVNGWVIEASIPPDRSPGSAVPLA